MKALVLAAGEGTRLGALTRDRPKPMVPIAGTPAIAFILTWLYQHGVREVAINLHHRPERLEEFVRDGSAFGLRVRYSREAELLGSAGALVPLRGYFATAPEFAVVYGDVLTTLDLRSVMEAHRGSGADATVVVATGDDPTRCGVVEFDRDGWISRFVEKPPAGQVFSPWINAGVYVCGPGVLAALPEPCPVPYDFGKDLFPRLLSRGARLLAFPARDRVIDFGSPERLADAEQAVVRGEFAFGRWSRAGSC
jgi:NDP-sugar pyrophosphorylase family protein